MDRRISDLRLRSAGTVAFLAVLAIGLPGCLSIKSQGTAQRAPGVISLNVDVCASDRDRNVYPDCDPSSSDPMNTPQNTAESDGGDEALDDVDGQALVGFRVPVGTIAPSSFLSVAEDVSFARSATYEAELNRLFPPGAGARWIGYLSTQKHFDLNAASGRQISLRPEFTLPPQRAPFTGSFAWRAVAGIRAGDPSDPVSCTFGTICIDSPVAARVPTNLLAAVSDFGVLTGASATAGHGETATVAFPVRYLDGRGFGARNLSMSATTSLPGSSATPSVTTLRAAPGSTNTVNVTVPVPPATPLGAYTVTLSAATGSPAVRRSNTATIQVADKLAPNIRISTPADGMTFVQGQAVTADFACNEEVNGSGLASCSGPVAPGTAIDTGSVGTQTFKVDAADNAGNTATATTSYTVVAPPVVDPVVVASEVVVSPPERINVRLSFLFEAFESFTTFSKLQVKGVPSGSRVTATCTFKKKRCPVQARKPLTKRRASGTVSLNKRYTGIRLPVGTRITVTVTKPGAIGAVKILTVRAGKAPRVRDRCLPRGSKRSQRRC